MTPYALFGKCSKKDPLAAVLYRRMLPATSGFTRLTIQARRK